MSAPYRSYVLVSREQIARNYRAVRAVVGPRVEVAAVVKADAYGHGLHHVAARLMHAGADLFAPAVLRRLFAEHDSGAYDHGTRLWALLCFRLWSEEMTGV